ncbi:MAG: PilZ domain-containing protein [Methylococcales bacterium]|nr:PilZ domain-containing protein [Methylococcales bacterium]
MSKAPIAEDRRRFFRIDDEINLHYKSVDEKTVNESNQVVTDMLNNCSLVTALDILGQDAQTIMKRVEKSSPDIAEYLQIMDAKISLIAKEAMKQEHGIADDKICNVNISASGIAFESNQQATSGDFLEIKLLLPSCFTVIVTYGKVVYCRNNRENEEAMPFLIGIHYINLNEHDREILVKYIVKRQMQQIREQKEHR